MPNAFARPPYSSCDDTPTYIVVPSRTGDPLTTDARWLSSSVIHFTAAVFWSIATRYDPGPGFKMTSGGSRTVPKMTRPPVTRGVSREAQPPSAPGLPPAVSRSATLFDHTGFPVAASRQVMLPPQSGKYTLPPTTAGVAETSPAVTPCGTLVLPYCHLTASLLTLSRVSAQPGACAVLQTFWPNMGQSVDAGVQSGWATDGIKHVAFELAPSCPDDAFELPLLLWPQAKAADAAAATSATSTPKRTTREVANEWTMMLP